MKKYSLKELLVFYFGIIVATIILVISFYMSYKVISAINKNTKSLTAINMKEADDILSIRLEEYEDLLYQLYTSEDMVEWAVNMNDGLDTAVTTSKLRRYLSSVLNSKDYVRSISVMFKGGTVITYDQLTPATYENTWIDNFSMTFDEFYADVNKDNKYHIYPTEFGNNFANKDNYLFHIAHRITNYKRVGEEYGIIIVSIDEALLADVLESVKNESESVVFLVGKEGKVISDNDKSHINVRVFDTPPTQEEKLGIYQGYIEKTYDKRISNRKFYLFSNKEFGWDIVYIYDDSEYMSAVSENVVHLFLISVVLLILSIYGVFKISGMLTKDISLVVDGMQKTSEAGIPLKIEDAPTALEDVKLISTQYNDTLNRLYEAMEKERREEENTRNAELKMLEAQINPHFIYNTLDTINWMAIDKDEYDISNAINSLAIILRYAISNRNQIVTIKDEIDWLKKYVYLQQFRLKNKFVCNINADNDLYDVKIHKMMIQPFVENAVIHGFNTKRDEYRLRVSIYSADDRIFIEVEDNGKGLSKDMTDVINEGDPETIKEKVGVGMYNAITRLNMYSGGSACISIDSRENVGTTVKISIPRID